MTNEQYEAIRAAFSEARTTAVHAAHFASAAESRAAGDADIAACEKFYTLLSEARRADITIQS